MRTKIGALVLTIMMVTVGLTAIAPSAAANHGCTPDVGVDDNHSPAGEWTTHNHPRFTFPTGHCREVTTQVNPSWRGAFNTNADDYHPTLGSGEYDIQVRTLYEYAHTHSFWHCHSWFWGVCWSWHLHQYTHWHQAWTGWVTSPEVKIDITPPDVEISDIGEPFVQDPDADYLTSDTEITLSASDAHSGVDRIEWRVDDRDWQTYDGSATITGEDGEHTFTYRAIDNVGLETVKSRDFILDNTAPEQEMIRPNANSATFGDFAVETCNGAIRITDEGETLFMAPDHRAAADEATGEAGTLVDGASSELPTRDELEGELPGEAAPVRDELPATPEAPEVVNSGPDECSGDVVETNALTVVTPTEEDVQSALEDAADRVPAEELDPVLAEIDAILSELPQEEIDAARDQLEAAVQELADQVPQDEIDGVVDDANEEVDGAVDDANTVADQVLAEVPQEEIDAARDQVIQAVEDAREQLPQEEIDAILDELPQEEIDAILDELPEEPPEAPEQVTVEGQDVNYDPVFLVSGTIELELDVQDALVGTATVSFLVDGEVQETQSNGDGVYLFKWETSEVPAGTHEVTLQATDRLGNQGELTFTAVVISSTPPEAPNPEDVEPPEEVPEPPEVPEVPEDPPEPPEPAVALPELTDLPEVPGIPA